MIPSSHFELVAGPEDNDTYIDYEFTDRSPRSAFRTWKLWWDAEVQKWFALLMRSQTEESEFNHEVKLSARFVLILRGAIPSSHLAARLVEAASMIINIKIVPNAEPNADGRWITAVVDRFPRETPWNEVDALVQTHLPPDHHMVGYEMEKSDG